MSCLQTLLTILLCYWLFVVAETKYEVQIILMGTMCSLIDWKEWTSDPYFFSITVVLTVVSIGQLMWKIYQEHGVPSMHHTLMEWVNWVHVFGYRVVVLMMCVLVCMLIQAIPEALCLEFNGFFYEMAKVCRLVPLHTEGFTLVTLSTTEREVSTYKLKCRMFHVVYLLVCLCIWYYLRYLTESSIFTSLIYMNLMMMGYFSLSVLNQIIVLYFRTDVLELHEKNNHKSPELISLNLPYSLHHITDHLISSSFVDVDVDVDVGEM